MPRRILDAAKAGGYEKHELLGFLGEDIETSPQRDAAGAAARAWGASATCKVIESTDSSVSGSVS